MFGRGEKICKDQWESEKDCEHMDYKESRGRWEDNLLLKNLVETELLTWASRICHKDLLPST